MAETRPPVVGIFGHIDHGKSTLVDYIRKSNITEKEAGGITQHVSAYEILHKASDGRERKITFLDTPGHEAFAGIRERGTNVADIAILVVSAEDGVKPQTLEAVKHIKKTETPYIVAISKVDKPGANIDRTKQNLAENEVYVEGFGGDVPVVPLSGKTGQGVDELLETVSLLSDIEGFTTEPDENGSGVIIESRLDPKQGIVGVGVVKSGVVRRGMFASVGGATAPLRLILDGENRQVEELSASSPIQIIGWSEMPQVGSTFKTFLKKEGAVAYAGENSTEKSTTEAVPEGLATLSLVVKADTIGSLEALTGEIRKLSRERIMPRIIFSGVGKVSESDVKTALAAENSVVVSFHVKSDKQAEHMAERAGTQILSSNIIYELVETISKLLDERTPKVETEEIIGKIKILKTFSATGDKQVIGGKVTEGELKLGASVRVLRRDADIGKGKIRELQQAKSKTSAVSEGNECGLMVESKTGIAPGDVLEAFVIVTK